MKYLCSLLFLLLAHPNWSQDLGQLGQEDARLFSLYHKGDKIDFIKIPQENVTPKPTIVMMQGSLPIPLAIQYPEGLSFTSFPFDLTKAMRDSFHFVVISMPDIPVIADLEQIDQRAQYINAPESYRQKNHLDHYVARANAVIDYLSQQAWTSGMPMVLFGHSQGSYVALTTAVSNDKISKIGLSSFTPTGRFSQYISKVRVAEREGQMSPEQADATIRDYYKYWQEITDNKTIDNAPEGDTYKATYSFSRDFTDDVTSLHIPVFIAYGSRDIGPTGCDILPLKFIDSGKSDYKLLAMPGLGHNYEPLDPNGIPDYNNMRWGEVFQSFLEWVIDK